MSTPFHLCSNATEVCCIYRISEHHFYAAGLAFVHSTCLKSEHIGRPLAELLRAPASGSSL